MTPPLRIDPDQDSIRRSAGRRVERARPFEPCGIGFEPLLNGLNGIVHGRVDQRHVQEPSTARPAGGDRITVTAFQYVTASACADVASSPTHIRSR